MRTSIKLSLIIIVFITALILIVYYFRDSINILLNSSIIGNILLVILIIVDLVVGLVPLFVYKLEQLDKRKKEEESKPILSIEYSNEKNQQATFAPELELVDTALHPIYGASTRIIRKYLRVLVKNTGGGVARNCKANLRLVRFESERAPTDDSKALVWEGRLLERNIAAKGGSELLHVVFSDSSFDERSDNIHALVSKDENLYPQIRNVIWAQDAFGIGIFEVELTIMSEEGSSVKAMLRINVTKSFKELSMEKLS